ncbi:receptor-like protein 8 [Quercus robur]|uniref:receptor-like protein 8 n=1 Tax=Quercus robur TaxID=38942 RepID=UPI002163D5BE|nr:receptor-like protein 8 [Quercus robur]
MKVGASQYFSMEWPLVRSLLWVLVLVAHIHELRACIEEERMGLLELKAYLKSNTNYTEPLLPSWVYDLKSECCNWERVKCNNTTGYVIKLWLSNIIHETHVYADNENWFLNESLLQPFKELRILDLSRNGIRGWQGNKDMTNFRSLEILDMSGNMFTGILSPYIGTLSSLKAISLSQNKLHGNLHAKDLGMLKKLEELDLSDNHFEWILPPCLSRLTSLRLLDLSKNQFSGNLSSSVIANLTSLEYIDLSYNRFGGLFSFSSFANHSKLKVIRFKGENYRIEDGNKIVSENNTFEIETENPSWEPSFQLKMLVLPNCDLNKLSSNIPKFLFYQQELELVDISHNRLKGSFPVWLIENNTRLQLLNLRDNYFGGQFHLPIAHCNNLSWLDFSYNNFNGQLQETIGKVIPNLQYLNISQNHFEGFLPSSIGDMSNLEKLDLSNNNFSGEVPMKLVANCTSMAVLKLSYNKFHGEIFSKGFRYFNSSLRILELKNNQLTGTLPTVVPAVGSRLGLLDISDNGFSGLIPRWLAGNLRYAWSADMSNNFFEGPIPCEMHAFILIDLSHNLLSEWSPSCVDLYTIQHLFLQGNKLTGSLPKLSFNFSLHLVTLDIRDNKFYGRIPIGVGMLPNLRILLLSGNNFSGVIQNKLCWLKNIAIMDLSRNNFSGTIPHCFHDLKFEKIDAFDGLTEPNSTFLEFRDIIVPYQSILKRNFENFEVEREVAAEIGIEFEMKYRSYFYKGGILDLMSGLDLSVNKLTGGIPPELGQLSPILALNLSYNQLTGSIPNTFSKLTQLESLDLSHNNLSGEIPSTLIDLHFLAVFNVAYNNLSSKVPDMKGQFGTFENSSYEGNPFLCGPPLEKSCTRVDKSPPSPIKSSNASHGKWYDVDPLVFSTTFIVSYIIFFIGVACILYINPYWQQRCFNFAFYMLERLSNCICH